MVHTTEIMHRKELEVFLKRMINNFNFPGEFAVSFEVSGIFLEVPISDKLMARFIRQFRIKWGLYDVY